MAEENRLLVKLPPRLAANDAELHAVAARIFQSCRPVRSLTVDCGRTAAVVPDSRRGQADLRLAEAEGALRGVELSARAIAAPPLVELLSGSIRATVISFIKMPARARGWRKALYLLLAGIVLSLGLLGIVLPGLPTTPFVLLASYFPPAQLNETA